MMSEQSIGVSLAEHSCKQGTDVSIALIYRYTGPSIHSGGSDPVEPILEIHYITQQLYYG